MSILYPLRALSLITGFTVLTAAYCVMPLAAQVTFETHAISGQAAPGTEPGIIFGTNLGTPTINAAGQIAFRGFLTGSNNSFTRDAGIWAGASGNLRLVAREGSQAPGTEAGVIFNSSSFTNILPVLNDAGQTAFSATLTGNGVVSTNDTGYWSEAAGTIGNPGLVVREGSQAPGTEAGVIFSSNGLANPIPRFNDAGQIAFSSDLSGNGVDSSNVYGIWSEAAGASGDLGLVVRSGTPAPGTDIGVNFSVFVSPSFNATGQTAFRAILTGPGVNDTNDRGIWSEAAGTNGNFGLVARKGNQAPGTAAGVNFGDLRDPNSLGAPSFNDAGQTAFRASLIGTGVDGTNNSGIWSEAAGTNGSPGLVARTGDPAPGTEPGVNFSFLYDPVLNAAGQTAFRGALTGTGVDFTNNGGIWSEAAGSIGSPGLVARAGDSAPGTTPGVNFSNFDRPVLNNAGQIAFFGLLTGTGVNGSNDRGIWVTDLDEQIRLVIRLGDTIDIDDDPNNEDFRTINGFSILKSSFVGSDSSQVTPFNDAGQIAFRASFTDGSSGIFVANTVAQVLPGDYNGDGFVSQADLDLVLLNWGDTVMPDGFDPAAVPGNSGTVFDGLISQNELDGILLNWGDGNPPNLNAIPEPTTLALLAPALFTVSYRWPASGRCSPRRHGIY